MLRARHTVFDRVRKLEEGGGIFTGLPEFSDGVVRTDLSGTLRPDFWFALPLYLSICVGVCYTSKDNGKSGKSCVKADKQAAGNLPDGSLFGKAFHESKD